MDYGLDLGLKFELDWTVGNVLALAFKERYECWIA